MTNQNPAGLTRDEAQAVREWAEGIMTGVSSARIQAAARVILDAVPAPAPPTMADMTDEERSACRWMQCDYAGETSDFTSPGVIGYFDNGDRKAVILTPRCGIVRRDYDRVTPRPDLPSMEWPGTEKAAVALAPALPEGWRLADHERHGRVVVTNPTPDADGHVYFVAPTPGVIGNDWHICTPDELTYLDTGLEAADATD